MFYQKLRKVGNSLVVTIPVDELERHNLSEGDLVGLQVTKAEIRPVLREEIQQAFDESWADHEDSYRYLGGG